MKLLSKISLATWSSDLPLHFPFSHCISAPLIGGSLLIDSTFTLADPSSYCVTGVELMAKADCFAVEVMPWPINVSCS